MSVPAPAGATVAVISRRGRFLVVEPFFPSSGSSDRTSRRAIPRGAVVGPARGGPQGAADGDLVLLQAQRTPGRRSSGPARPEILRVIGRPEVARDVIEALMLDRGLSRGFDPAVEREARQASKDGVVPDGRRDLRELPTFTIDPSDARDFDDAISAERTKDGTIRVYVHIADVGAYVREASPLDREAHRRATSVYVPGAVEPMLPLALSGDACSLVPGADRPALTAEIDLDGPNVKRVAFHRSIIRSDMRLTYEQVDAIFAGAERAGEPWGAPLAVAREAASALQDARLERSALTLDSPEPEFRFDSDGHVSEIGLRRQTESHRLIEHLMITANEAVARLLERRKMPCLYRVHERPDPERVTRLVEQLATLDVPTPPLPEHMSATQAADVLGEVSARVERHLQSAVARARRADPRAPSSGGRLALTSLILRSLKQAYYSPSNIGHAGLGSSCYCHFTSPIRRYPDLVCHRSLVRAIGPGNDSSGRSARGLTELGEWTSERERHAMSIERDADDVACCFSLERLLYRDGWEQTFTGEITGLISAGAFVAFGPSGSRSEGSPAMPIYEGMLAVRRLAGKGHTATSPDASPGRSRRHLQTRTQAYAGREWWELSELGTILQASRSGATLRLGEATSVRVVSVEPARGRVDLTPADG